MSEGVINITEGTGTKISTQTMTINSQSVHVERSMLGMGVVTMPGTPQVNAVSVTGLTPASAIDIQGRYYIICKNTYNDTEAYAQLRIAFYDSASTLIGYSEAINIRNLGIAISSRYMGDNIIYSNDFGAKEIKFYIESISSGDDISIYVGAV